MSDIKILIKMVEEKRNKLLKNKYISKKIKKEYFNKYNELLLDLYTKYEGDINSN